MIILKIIKATGLSRSDIADLVAEKKSELEVNEAGLLYLIAKDLCVRISKKFRDCLVLDCF